MYVDMGMLRKAGQALLDKDQQYANFVKGTARNEQGLPKSHGAAVREMTSGLPVREIYAEPSNSVEDELMTALLLGSNLGSRYALPAGGLTAAGVGLYDIIQNSMGGEQTSGTVMP